MDKITKFIHDNDKWDIYNGFFLMDDVERLRKFIVREHLFKMTIELPGDIVEVGVFKGTGMAQFLKLKEIFIPASNKKLVGFDLFDKSLDFKNTLTDNDIELNTYYTSANINMDVGIPKTDIENIFNSFKLTNNKNTTDDLYQLIDGDVKETIPEFLSKYPGFRISLLNLDLDIDEPTYISLSLLYDRVVRGGIIIFDEYACDRWTESNAVDRFLKEHPELQIKTLPWARTPTAYIIKP